MKRSTGIRAHVHFLSRKVAGNSKGGIARKRQTGTIERSCRSSRGLAANISKCHRASASTADSPQADIFASPDGERAVFVQRGCILHHERAGAIQVDLVIDNQISSFQTTGNSGIGHQQSRVTICDAGPHQGSCICHHQRSIALDVQHTLEGCSFGRCGGIGITITQNQRTRTSYIAQIRLVAAGELHRSSGTHGGCAADIHRTGTTQGNSLVETQIGRGQATIAGGITLQQRSTANRQAHISLRVQGALEGGNGYHRVSRVFALAIAQRQRARTGHSAQVHRVATCKCHGSAIGHGGCTADIHRTGTTQGNTLVQAQIGRGQAAIAGGIALQQGGTCNCQVSIAHDVKHTLKGTSLNCRGGRCIAIAQNERTVVPHSIKLHRAATGQLKHGACFHGNVTAELQIASTAQADAFVENQVRSLQITVDERLTNQPNRARG